MFVILIKKNIRFLWVKGIKILLLVKVNVVVIYNGNSLVDIEFFYYWVNLIFKIREFSFYVISLIINIFVWLF